MSKLLIIDSSSLIFRSFYAQPHLTNTQNIPTGALYGFAKMLISFLNQESIEYIVAVFDSGQKNFRHQLYPQYKANRSSPPSELIEQLKRSKEIVEALSIQFLDIVGYEADDIIATLCKQYENEFECTIISSDKDLMQLINSKTKMYDSMKKILYDCKNVKKKLLVEASQVIDYLSLVGDASDNIPGVKSIGPKTAVELIQQFKSLENIYNNIEHIEKARTKKLLLEGQDSAFLSQKLVTLYDKVQLGNFNLEKWFLKDLSYTQKIFSFYEFESIYPQIQLLKLKYSNVANNLKEAKLTTLINKKRFVEYIAIELEDNNKVSIDSNIFKKEEFILTDINETLIEILSYSHIEKYTSNIKKIWHIFDKYDTQLPKTFFTGWQDIILLKYSTSIGQEHIDEEKFFHSIGHFYKYNALGLYDTFNKLKYQNKNKYHFYEYFDKPNIKVLFNMEKIGIKVNKDKLSQISNEIQEELLQLKQEIFQETKTEFDINSPKQLSHILFTEMGIPPIKKNTKSGIYSTNSEVLTQLASMNYHIAHLLLQWRNLSKIKNTYTDPLQEFCDENNRVHSTFLPTLTNTGRLSSINPNLQNIPRGQLIRQVFIADINKSFIIADYSQIELRILAHMAQVTKMQNAFIQNQDIHSETANAILGSSNKENRNKAKAINFGIIYGMSAYGLSQQINSSFHEAKEYLDKYYDTYPEITEFMKNNIEFNRKYGFIYNIFHRPIYIDISKSAWERIVMNAPMQSSVADIMKLSMNRIYDRLKNANIVLQIHDEIIVESDDHYLAENKQIILEEMENVNKLINLNLKVNISIHKSWFHNT